MSNVTPFRARQVLHDYAREDRQQFLLHTRAHEALREEWTRERNSLELAMWSMFLGFCGALVAVVMLLAHFGVID